MPQIENSPNSQMPSEAEMRLRRSRLVEYILEGLTVVAPQAGKVLPRLDIGELVKVCRGKYSFHQTEDGILLTSKSENQDLIDCFIDNTGQILSASFCMYSLGTTLFVGTRYHSEYEYEDHRLVSVHFTVLNANSEIEKEMKYQYVYLTEHGDDSHFITVEEKNGEITVSRRTQ